MSEYEANHSAIVHEEWSVRGEGGGIPWAAGMGKYVCREQPKIIQHRIV